MLHPWMPARNWTDILIAGGHSPISPGSFAIGLEAEMVRKNNYMIEKHETSGQWKKRWRYQGQDDQRI